MKKILVFIGLLFVTYTSTIKIITLAELQLTKKRVMLPNGWQLSPAGRHLPLGDLPLNMAVSSSKKLLAVTNNGQSVQSIQLINTATEKILDNIVVATAWYGLKFSTDEKWLYASAGNDNLILRFAITNNKLLLKDSIVLGKKWLQKISPSGIDIDDAAGILYVVTKEDNKLYMINLSTKKVFHQTLLGKAAYTCLLSPDKKELYISLWGGNKIVVFDTGKRKITANIAVGDNPNEIILNKKGNVLYIANANDNSVSVVNVRKRSVMEVLNTALFAHSPIGSAPNGLALSSNEHTLYIANADNNCLAVFNVKNQGKSNSKGFIPTGWYPTNVKVVGKKIFVTNGKGFSSFANPKGPNPASPGQLVEQHVGDTTVKVVPDFIAGLMKGTLSIIDEPNEALMAIYSRAVYKNTRYRKQLEFSTAGEKGNPIPMKVGASSPIKYVFYIIKENRTYDQVLGDVKEGNGDTSLVLFGEKITPNQHKLAKEFVLLDNFYADGEVSADGHNWSTSANATEYLEKTWVSSYGKRGGSFDAEGRSAIANPPKGFIWDYCNRAGVSYRTYGEFIDDGKPNIPSLRNHFCTYYPNSSFDTRDTTRFSFWRKEFDSLLNVNQVPRFNSIWLGNDHTKGLVFGSPTPFAFVADNDLAVGLFVEHLSKSSIWKECAIFIVEDDAQNGPDHVDAHRTTAFLAGPFVKRGFVDHNMYSTSSMLRTIELILGLPPMSQFDAAATPMWHSFTANANYKPFAALPSTINLNDKNTATNATARLSSTFDFSEEDKVPDIIFSQVIWKAVKGEQATMPAPRRSAFLKTIENDD